MRQFFILVCILVSLSSYAQSGKWVKFLKVEGQTLYIDPNVQKDPDVYNNYNVFIKITYDSNSCRVNTKKNFNYSEEPYVTIQNLIFLEEKDYYAVRSIKTYGQFSNLIFEQKEKIPFDTYPVKSRLEKKIKEIVLKYYFKNNI